MLARRLGSNIPAPLRKKKEENYKQFITPSGNPIAYVRQHIRYVLYGQTAEFICMYLLFSSRTIALDKCVFLK